VPVELRRVGRRLVHGEEPGRHSAALPSGSDTIPSGVMN
jgi:hypothetical protein